MTKQDKKCQICDATQDALQVPDVVQDGRWAGDLVGAYYPKPQDWDRQDGETYCARCATEVDKAKMLQGLHGNLTYTNVDGVPVEITNRVMTMYWQVLFVEEGKRPGYWRAEFIHGTQVWRATCYQGRAVAEKKYDMPAFALMAGGHTPGASPRFVSGQDRGATEFEFDPAIAWVQSESKGRK